MGKGSSASVGQQLLLLLALLGAAGGAGAWNYQRNLALEAGEVRPYGSLSTPDLELLLDATEGEAAALTNAYEAAGSRAVPAGDGSGRYAGFEAAQHRGRAVRDLGATLAGHEASIAEMRKELTRRRSEGDTTKRFWRRVLTF